VRPAGKTRPLAYPCVGVAHDTRSVAVHTVGIGVGAMRPTRKSQIAAISSSPMIATRRER
jgi:hypothetical protein